MDHKQDIRKRINKCLDRMGPYHILLLSAFATFCITAGYSNSMPMFYTYTPSYDCGRQEQASPNDTQWDVCEGIQSPHNCTFDPTEEFDSIVTEYHLVCSDRYLSALSSTLYFVGVTIGALICCPLSDHFGRRLTLQVVTIGHILMGLFIHFEALTPNISAFISLRIIQGALNQGLQTIAFTSFLELTPARFRTLLGCLSQTCFSLGMIKLALISSFTHHWRILQLYMLIPTALAVVATFLIPESMLWQWTRNNFRGIISTYTKIARRNKDHKFIAEEEEFQRDKDWQQVKRVCVAKADHKMHTLAIVRTIFQSHILRKHILIMALFWFSVTISYYAIAFFVPNLGDNRHTNIMIGGAVEIVGYVVLYFAMQRFGRGRVLGVFTILSACLCVMFAVLELIGGMTEATRDTTEIVVMLLAKALVISAFCGLFIFTGELFPTFCRGTTFGILGFFSRVGSLLAPQIIALTEVVSPALPLFLLGALLVCAGGLLFVLPETRNIDIPNTMEDVEELWGKGLMQEEKVQCLQ